MCPRRAARLVSMFISAHIQGRVQISTELKPNKLGDEPTKGAEQIRSVHKVRIAL